ncbi:GlsB/YeaQ/YmgE family stress response membrane protein [Belliella kenyensis]|uniref:GlsB/YeaQ/YmgE family stress response membrane protein n=1 Tax=Belliella kenyensis TaxID=1472724 RepID=A0ABV8EJH9_9BACT|nr:GlsB/YeaQ/YmgE family stress response membrane protein [Belliella kenyensis]MCH7400280.1 GlsB/YeaQ/YmgE family stress response membrane protein [Belliella kenyensis]MDN3604702.1 GlsB/YeaQ/YmgE family stress response membrane protein [Belliella kenyensis]MDN3605261.1 GlsB/YeaQ/YmgE family stress response membrane protein [Belliella kenyensis]
MSWIAYIIFGLIAGVIAKMIHPGKDPGGWIITILLGILGSLVGRWLAGILGLVVSGSFWSPMNWIVSIGGAVLLLFIHAKLTKK